MTSKIIKYLSIITALAFSDQLTKTFLITYLKTKPGFIIELLPFLDLVYAWNYGISFGLFSKYYQYSNYVLLLLNSVIVVYLANLLLKADAKSKIYGLNLIIAGAIGNLIDRIIRGAVFDFIYFNYNGYDFPAFNVADSFITVGGALFIWGYLRRKKPLAEQ